MTTVLGYNTVLSIDPDVIPLSDSVKLFPGDVELDEGWPTCLVRGTQDEVVQVARDFIAKVRAHMHRLEWATYVKYVAVEDDPDYIMELRGFDPNGSKWGVATALVSI